MSSRVVVEGSDGYPVPVYAMYGKKITCGGTLVPDFKSLQARWREILMYAIQGGFIGECFTCPLQTAKLYKEKKAFYNCTRFFTISRYILTILLYNVPVANSRDMFFRCRTITRRKM